MKSKYLVVLSFDALSKKDFNLFSEMPNFKKLIRNSSYSKNVKSVDPTLTYVCHTSIITGQKPINHGITTNTLLQPNRLDSPDWFWYRNYIKKETVYDLARNNNLKVASLLWPVTAKAKIKWNMPEIWSNRFWQNQILVSSSNGSLFYQLELNKKFGNIRNGKSQPELDDFTTESVIYTIKKYKPNLLLAHFIDLDTMRHYNGHDSNEAVESIKRLDNRLGKIIDAIKEEGIFNETTLVVLGDHAQIPVNKAISLNSLFANKGLLDRIDNRVRNWEAISKSNDGSCYIYVKNKSKIDKVRNILLEFIEKTGSVKSFIEKDEIKKLGMDFNADFVLDAYDGYYFEDRVQENVIISVFDENGDLRDGYLMSSHGYLNGHDDYETVFFAMGPSIKKNYEIKNMSLIDEGPTFARILGLELKNTDGNSLEEIFE